jgi:hypothetical protein
MGGERSIETVQHGKELLNQIFDPAMSRLIALFLSSLPVIVEIRLQTHERIRQILFLRCELLDLLGQRRVRPRASRRAGIVAA